MARHKSFSTHGLTFAEADKLLGNRDECRVPKCGNTRLIRTNADAIGVQFHDTIIVSIGRNGTFAMFTGGYRTATTKQRLNQFTPTGVYQKGGVWYHSNGSEFNEGDIV